MNLIWDPKHPKVSRESSRHFFAARHLVVEMEYELELLYLKQWVTESTEL